MVYKGFPQNKEVHKNSLKSNGFELANLPLLEINKQFEFLLLGFTSSYSSSCMPSYSSSCMYAKL